MRNEAPSHAPPSATPLAGLTEADIVQLRETHGWNELPRPPRTPAWQVLARQFTSFLVLILIVAALIAFLLGERIDTAAIMMVVLLNGILGFVQEWRAETALETLRSMLSPQAVVRRNGQAVVVAARELLPGDIILLEAGDKIPADADLITALQLRVDESVLTGESVPVGKAVEDEGVKLFTGTSVVAGRAEGVVTEIGANTAFGKIATLTGSVGTKKTNLQIQLGRLAKQLGGAALAVAALILTLGLLLGHDTIEMFMTALSLSVAVVPEGLPAVVTITLALGAAAMVRQKALARRLQAVETLGAASVICTDKTGTLTENKMTATRIWTPDATYHVTGTGYDPEGHIARDGTRVRAGEDATLAAILETVITCSHARLTRDDAEWRMVGEPTEGALVTLAYKGWAAIPDPANLVEEIPFNSDRKRMTVLARIGGDLKILTKGAPEQVLEICTDLAEGGAMRPLTDADRASIRAAYDALASDGLPRR